MSRGIVDLIQDNKRRFYAGEIRNNYFELPKSERDKMQSTIINEPDDADIKQTSVWQNLKSLGQKLNEDIFYETVR